MSANTDTNTNIYKNTYMTMNMYKECELVHILAPLHEHKHEREHEHLMYVYVYIYI
jgi:hypothetical protein